MKTGEDGRGDGFPGGRITRRAYLGALGAGGLLGSLAGCTEPNEIVDSPDVFGYQFPYDAETTHVGPWSTSDPSAFYPILFEAESYTTPGRERQLGDVVDSISVDGATATVSYAEGFSWWSGDPVTARDPWIQERIQSYVSTGSRPEVSLVDEYTLQYEFDRPLDRTLAVSRVTDGMVRTKAEFYDPWLDRLEDATSERRRREIITDLRNDSPNLQTVSDEGLGCGPYELVEVSINRLMFERYDDHPRADDLSIPRLWFPVVEQVSIENLVSKGWLDGGLGLLRNERGSPPDHLEQLASYRTNSGTKLVLDWRNKHLARTGVRRAILSILPVDDIVDVTNWGEPTVRQNGLAVPAERRWLTSSFLEALHEYPVGADEERATAYMEAAGYTRDGREDWYGPDGARARVRVGTPVWDAFVSASSVVSSSLDQFGFDVTTDRIPNTKLHYEVTNHTYDVMLWPFDGNPFTVYDVTSDAAASIGYGVTDPATARSSQGKPIAVRVPETPGAVDAPESDRRRVNLVETWRTIEGPSDHETTVDAIRTFATWWNDALPDLYLGSATDGVWGNTRDFTWPAPETGSRYGTAGADGNPIFHMLKHGSVGSGTDG